MGAGGLAYGALRVSGGGTPWVLGGPVGRWGVPRVGPAMNGVTPWVLGALRVGHPVGLRERSGARR